MKCQERQVLFRKKFFGELKQQTLEVLQNTPVCVAARKGIFWRDAFIIVIVKNIFFKFSFQRYLKISIQSVQAFFWR